MVNKQRSRHVGYGMVAQNPSTLEQQVPNSSMYAPIAAYGSSLPERPLGMGAGKQIIPSNTKLPAELMSGGSKRRRSRCLRKSKCRKSRRSKHRRSKHRRSKHRHTKHRRSKHRRSK